MKIFEIKKRICWIDPVHRGLRRFEKAFRVNKADNSNENDEIECQEGF